VSLPGTTRLPAIPQDVRELAPNLDGPLEKEAPSAKPPADVPPPAGGDASGGLLRDGPGEDGASGGGTAALLPSDMPADMQELRKTQESNISGIAGPKGDDMPHKGHADQVQTGGTRLESPPPKPLGVAAGAAPTATLPGRTDSAPSGASTLPVMNLHHVPDNIVGESGMGVAQDTASAVSNGSAQEQGVQHRGQGQDEGARVDPVHQVPHPATVSGNDSDRPAGGAADHPVGDGVKAGAPSERDPLRVPEVAQVGEPGPVGTLAQTATSAPLSDLGPSTGSAAPAEPGVSGRDQARSDPLGHSAGLPGLRGPPLAVADTTRGSSLQGQTLQESPGSGTGARAQAGQRPQSAGHAGVGQSGEAGGGKTRPMTPLSPKDDGALQRSKVDFNPLL
jgi:hypothetical protein